MIKKVLGTQHSELRTKNFHVSEAVGSRQKKKMKKRSNPDFRSPKEETVGKRIVTSDDRESVGGAI